MEKVILEEKTTDIEEIVCVLKSCILYCLHVDPWNKEKFIEIIERGYNIAKKNLLAISYLNDKEQLMR